MKQKNVRRLFRAFFDTDFCEKTFIMEFNEKLQELRKRKGLTQEQLAESLYVSRTAVSKWESGRGYPSIDSLKRVAEFFSVTIDELLSGDDILTVLEEKPEPQEKPFRERMFGLLDLSTVLLFFLPFFGQVSNGTIRGVSLLTLTGSSPYMRTAYFSIVTGMIVSGILTLALPNCRNRFWEQNKANLSFLLNTAGLLLFILSRQPYAAVFLFLFLAIKGIFLSKKQ